MSMESSNRTGGRILNLIKPLDAFEMEIVNERHPAAFISGKAAGENFNFGAFRWHGYTLGL